MDVLSPPFKFLCIVAFLANAFVHTKEISVPKCLSFNEALDINCNNIDLFYEKNDNRLIRINQKLNWSNIVIFIPMHQNHNVDNLIKFSFSTWLKRIGVGAHVIFITDSSDSRSLKEILPDADIKTKATVRLFKTSAKNEGYRLRYKMIDSLRILTHYYDGTHDEDKKYFIKIDTDTFVIPDNLLPFLQTLHQSVRNQPVLFGKAVCATTQNMCYVGGAMYGFSKDALETTYNFIAQNPTMINENHPHQNRHDVNLMEHEDYLVSYAYRMATGYPVVMNRQINNHVIERDGIGSKESVPICYHRIKAPRLYLEYFSLFYNDDGMPREYNSVEEIFRERMELKALKVKTS